MYHKLLYYGVRTLHNRPQIRCKRNILSSPSVMEKYVPKQIKYGLLRDLFNNPCQINLILMLPRYNLTFKFNI